METYLAHYGILGMKWGVRRYQNKDGTLTADGKIQYGRKTADKRRAASKKTPVSKKKADPPKQKTEQEQPKPRDVKSMSDEEIRQFLNRRDLEKRYIDAVTPKEIEKGKSATQKYIAKFGDSLASNIATGAAKRVANALLDSVFGSEKSGNKQKNKKNDDDDDE